jgi:hypothetical protein
LGVGGVGAQEALELEAVLEHVQVHVEALGPDRLVRVWALEMPAARAMPARSEPVAVAVGNPPTLSRLWLSNTMWVRFPGA